MLTRLPGWEQRLHALVAARRHAPFAWGANDCGAFAAAALQALRGAPVVPEHRRRTWREARRVVNRLGGLAAAAARFVGPEIPPGLAQRGDIVLVQAEQGPALAVCVGAVAVGPHADGLASIPRSAWLRAWRA